MGQPPLDSNIAEVLRRVSDAATRCSRDPDSITLLAVSKTQGADAVRAAAGAGLRHFGENYLQEAEQKIAACADLPLTWHFIGPIQSNKTRPIAAAFQWVHSVDRVKILQRLNDQRDPHLPALNVCIQVNISAEASKAGVAPQALPEILDIAAELPRLRLRGLMAIPAPVDEYAAQKALCDQLGDLLRTAQQRYPQLDTLSIGMSADLEAAVAAGSTILRIGTAIFGPRRRQGE